MRLNFLLAGIRLASKVVETANRNVFNTPGVLQLVNETMKLVCGLDFSSDGRTINPQFKVGDRGYDVTKNGGYPTIWIEGPKGYSIKVALDKNVDAILDEHRELLG